MSVKALGYNQYGKFETRRVIKNEKDSEQGKAGSIKKETNESWPTDNAEQQGRPFFFSVRCLDNISLL